MQPERFAAGLTPLPTAARVTQKRGALRWRIISTVISLAILAVIILTIGRDWPQEWTIAMVAIWVASSAFWIVVSVFGLQRAKRDLGRIQDGSFAREWILENKDNAPAFKATRRGERQHPIEEVGAKLRDMMPWIKKGALVDKTKN